MSFYSLKTIETIVVNLFDPNAVPKIDADFTGRSDSLMIDVGQLHIAATKGTADTSMQAAMDMAFEIAAQKVAQDVFKICHLLGVEGVLDPHTILSEYGVALKLRRAADESLNIQKLVDSEVQKRLKKAGIHE